MPIAFPMVMVNDLRASEVRIEANGMTQYAQGWIQYPSWHEALHTVREQGYTRVG